MAQVGAGATGWGATDDGWRSLADVLAQPPRPSARTQSALPPIPKRNDWAAPLETGVALAQVAAARSRIPVAEVRGPTKIKRAVAPAGPGWSTSERRLWWMAGGLMLLAAAVLSTLAILTFGGISISSLVAPASAHHEAAATVAVSPQVAVAIAAPVAPVAKPVREIAPSASPAIAHGPAAHSASAHATSHAAAAHAGASHRTRHHHRHHGHRH